MAGARLNHRRGTQQRVAREAKSWQKRLDYALLNVDAKPTARIRNLQKILQEPSAVLQDVGRAVSAIAEKGFREGHPEAIEALWPKGTMAREDLEGLQALRKQLPEVAQAVGGMEPSSVLSQRPPSVSLPNITSGLIDLLADQKKQKELVEEVKNVFRRKPKGLETPEYNVVKTLDVAGAGQVEIRRYKSFTVARQAMEDGKGSGFASGEGFTTLAGYLFGKNSDDVAMEMTSPVEISYGSSGAPVMSFVLPKAFADAPPTPDQASIELAQIPERLVAIRVFPGVVTEGEVERQREALSEALAASGAFQVVNSSEYSVLQYNPPYTLPWRRLNELALVVEEVLAEAEPGTEAVAEDPAEVAEEASGAEAKSETTPASGPASAELTSASGAAESEGAPGPSTLPKASGNSSTPA